LDQLAGIGLECDQRREHSAVKILRSLTSQSVLLEARRRRAMGDYSRATLGLYAKAWETARSPQNLLRYCLFRHELGYRPTKTVRNELRHALPQLSAKQREVADALLSCARCANQLGLQADFYAWLRSAENRTVAVVGNSAGLLGTRQAGDIEAAHCVIRFNHWKAAPEDVGRRTDVWVRSPLDIDAEESPAPVPAPRWIAVSGPEMDARRPEWDRWTTLNGCRLLSVPLHVWRALVRKLNAPPSAGLLMLAWLHSIRGCWEGIEVFGMGYAGGRYHASKSKHRASHRHRWGIEAALLRQWVGDGLKVHAAS
jgi:hypothetical protein